MGARHYDWEDYLYPVPEALRDNPFVPRVLRNIPGLTNFFELFDFEYDATLRRAVEIEVGLVEIPRTFDENHLRAIHHHLLQDVYEWAGQARTVDMAKPRPPYTRVDPAIPESEPFIAAAVIREGAAFMAADIRDIPWESLDANQVADGLASVHTQATYVHFFREGNGRVTRIFLEHLAEQAGYELAPFPPKDQFISAVVEANRGKPNDLAKILREGMTPLDPATGTKHTLSQRAQQLAAQPREIAPTIAPRAPYRAGPHL
jgi:fido (protein-threonine AMPylation protein)